MKNILCFLAITISFGNLFAQEIAKNGTPINEQLGFTFGYFGDKIVNHGYILGIEKYIATTNNFNVISTINFSNYFAGQNFTALSLGPRIGSRYTTDYGLILENHFGLGYLHRFYKYNEYEVNSNGDILSNKKASQPSAILNLILGTGYDFRRKVDLPVIYFLRSSLSYNYPNKHFFFETSFAIETGFTYIPKNKTKIK